MLIVGGTGQFGVSRRPSRGAAARAEHGHLYPHHETSNEAAHAACRAVTVLEPEEVAQVKGAVRRMADARTTPATSECAAAVERRAAMILAALEKAAPARAARRRLACLWRDRIGRAAASARRAVHAHQGGMEQGRHGPGILRRPGTPIREQLASQSFPSAPAEPSVAQGKLSPLPSATARASDPALGNIVSNANYRQGVRFRGGGRRPVRRRPVAGGASRRRRRR